MALPVLPSDVAVIRAVPLALTVAAGLLLLAHVTVRPVNMLPFASLVVAVSCTVCAGWTAAAVGDTVTVATGAAVTVMAAVPLCPSLVAVIVAPPATRAVTNPWPFTVATVVLLLAHVTVRPGSVFPFASFGVAVSCTV